MKTYRTLWIILIVMLTGAVNLAAQDNPFLEQLQLKLQEEEWNQAEIQNMIKACRTLNWEGTNPSHAGITARALQYGKERGNTLNLREQAMFALEVSLEAKNMEKAGLDERETAGVVMRSTREMYQKMAGWEEGENQDQDRIRERIRDCVESSVQSQLQITLRDRVRQGNGNVVANGSGSGKGGNNMKGKKQ